MQPKTNAKNSPMLSASTLQKCSRTNDFFRVRFRVQFRVQRISFATVFYPVVTVFYPVEKGIGSRIKSTKNREPCKFKGSRPKADDGNRTFQQPHIYGISDISCANSCASRLIFGIKKRPPKGPMQREGKRTSHQGKSVKKMLCNPAVTTGKADFHPHPAG